jgi:hypothetical protein
MKQHEINYSIALATYIGDEGFAKRLKNEQFRSFVMSQKEFIKNFLLTGYSIMDEQMDTPLNILSEPKPLSQYSQDSSARQATQENHSSSYYQSTNSTSQNPPPAKFNTGNTSSKSNITVNDIEKFIQQLIIEKTGYPIEMVLFDVDLDDELGIDTVKKMEILAEIGTHYQLKVKRDLNLSKLTTIQSIAEIVHQEIVFNAA